ncbi:polysaccharide pyruvyl transferase family protein [Chenggangzhangella methanolivorans]|uniref:Polysaccharide pyruvyl transferase family protein n=1 Tax=Chenggangzhangella methanolivorans TaxID=1437009 RepID=A0A9E6RBH4_9HYPH|nr:polysaccharide pyruvyl transferase family protein [Chenggangzhangella methanolivorans]QZO01167.1 polysaccharide pyruvyl transferase family protein [Chenggangzhangella methanolivorans]
MTRPAKILLIGAYANGNIGDLHQASSLAHHLSAILPEAVVHATSNSVAAKPYDFPRPDHVLPPSILRDYDRLSEYDAVIVGGGGLLAAIHRPLNSPNWPLHVTPPIILLSMGASAEVAQRCQTLIRRAAVVTGRDEQSCAVLRRFRDDVELIPDPILADERLDALRAPRETSSPGSA